MHSRRTLLAGAAALAGFLFASLPQGAEHGAQAADFPSGPIDYVIPFGPGGESDITARIQQDIAQQKDKGELVISYKPGGGGAVGWAQLNTMGEDGHSWMGINLPHIVIKPQQGEVGFQTDDITAVYMFHYTPDAIVVKADSEFQTLQDLVDFAKANPKKLTLSGSGKGTANHLAQVRFDQLAEIETTYIAFKGTGAAVTALLGDQVLAEWGYTSVGATQGDQVRLLAVAMEERHPLFPEVPTFKELGYDMVGGAYRGVAVPAGTPEETRQAVSDLIGAINADPDFRQRMIDGGFAVLDVPYGQAMDDFMAARAEEYLALARSAGVID